WCRDGDQTTETVGFEDSAVAGVRAGVLVAEAREVERVQRAQGPGEPPVAEPADPDAELAAVAGQAGDNAALFNGRRGIEGRLARGHRKGKEEFVVSGQEVEQRLQVL